MFFILFYGILIIHFFSWNWTRPNWH